MNRPRTYAETRTPSDFEVSFGDVEVRLANPVQIRVNGAAQTWLPGTWFVNKDCARALVAGDPNRRAQIIEEEEK